MEFTPRYPQPFTFQQAISFDPEVSADEITRLQNSISHLKRTQEELNEYVDDPDVAQAIKENDETIASQDERIFMLKLALSQQGASNASSAHYKLPSEIEDRASRQNGFGSGDNGLEPLDAPLPREDSDNASREAEEEQGLHL